jgi:hypothetical protein
MKPARLGTPAAILDALSSGRKARKGAPKGAA